MRKLLSAVRFLLATRFEFRRLRIGEGRYAFYIPFFTHIGNCVQAFAVNRFPMCIRFTLQCYLPGDRYVHATTLYIYYRKGNRGWRLDSEHALSLFKRVARRRGDFPRWMSDVEYTVGPFRYEFWEDERNGQSLEQLFIFGRCICQRV